MPALSRSTWWWWAPARETGGSIGWRHLHRRRRAACGLRWRRQAERAAAEGTGRDEPHELGVSERRPDPDALHLLRPRLVTAAALVRAAPRHARVRGADGGRRRGPFPPLERGRHSVGPASPGRGPGAPGGGG